jgi:hypothetical protein
VITATDDERHDDLMVFVDDICLDGFGCQVRAAYVEIFVGFCD